MLLNKFPDHDLLSQNLTRKELENPTEVIEEFFDYAHMPYVRAELWTFFKAAITGSFNKELSFRERANLVTLYEKLGKLLEAVHVLYNKKSNLS